MCLLYGISFLCSMIGFFGVGHLFAGAPSKAIGYLIAGFIWSAIMLAISGATGVAALILFPLHLVFAHFCAADAVRRARMNLKPAAG